jgi:hypothetical protein
MDYTENKAQRFELSEILKDYVPEFMGSHTLCPQQLKAINDIINCRSPDMKGHLTQCNHCGHREQSYNSCRNRHCNKCQFIRQTIWADSLKGKLIPGKYFHLVFTVPESLNKLFYINQSVCYDLIFQAAWSSLDTLCRNPRFLGARTGAVAILHTWSSTLVYHPHIHVLVPCGGLSEDGMEWISPRGNYLVPVKILSRLFRARCSDGLKRAIGKGFIEAPMGTHAEALMQSIYAKEWVVFAKKTGKTVDHVLEYLARYTHRVAIGNNRITLVEDGRVTFKSKDPHTGKYSRITTVEALEFIRRFVQHILPKGFCKIRYFGILATACQSSLEICRTLIGKKQDLPRFEGLPVYDVLRIVTGHDPSLCKQCKEGRMIPVFHAKTG